MAKLNNTFEFVGNMKFMKEPVKETTFTEKSPKKGAWVKKELKAMIKENENNGVFLNLEGGFYNKKGEPEIVYSYGKSLHGEEASKMQIPWDERKNPEVVNKVANFSKIVIDLTTDEVVKETYNKLRRDIYNIESNENATDEEKAKLQELYKEVKEKVPHRYEFLHELDAIDFIEKLSDKFEGRKLVVKGNVVPTYWNGDFRVNYEVKTIEIAKEDEVNKMQLDLDLYFSKSVINDALFKSKKLLTYDTFILAYDSQTKKEQFFPLQTVLDASNYDLENPKHKGHIDIIEKFFTVKNKDMTYQLPYSAKVVNGSEIIEFDESQLTEDQKLLIDIGMATLNDFKPVGNSFGDQVKQIRLLFPKIKNLGDGLDFSKGAKETLFKVSELKYVPKDDSEKPVEKKEDKVEKPVENEPNPFDISMDDLPF